MENKIRQRINRAIYEKVFPGCVVGVIKKGGERKIWPFGRFTYDSDSTIVKEDTIYDVASITKSIPTASLLLALVDKGVVALDDPAVKYLPEFGNQKEKELVLVRHLLTYTLDLVVPPMSSLKTKSADEIIGMAMLSNTIYPKRKPNADAINEVRRDIVDIVFE